MPHKIAIETPDAPKAIGPYSQAVVHGNLVYTSGQIALNPETQELVNDSVEAEAHQVFQNLHAVLHAAGTDLSKALKVTVFLQDLNDFAKVNEIYREYVTGVFPARSTVQVAKLPRGVRVEIDVIAAKD